MLNLKDKSIRFNLQSLLLIFASFALLSCGGGGDSLPSGGSSSSSSGGAAGINPVTPLTMSGTQILPVGGGQSSVTFESGFNGLIEVNTQTVTAVEVVTQTFQLTNGTPSLNIVALDRVMAFDFSCDDGRSFVGTSSSDFSTGIVTSNGTVNGQALSCTSTYQPAVPATISDTQSIQNLLLNALAGDDSDPGFISSDCPDDDFNDFNPFTSACTGDILTNITATDDSAGVHLASTKLSFTTGASSSSSSSSSSSTSSSSSSSSSTSSSSSSTSTSSSSSSGGGGAVVAFSGTGAIDPPSASSPGTSFTNVDYEEFAFGGGAINMSWEDSNGTIIAVLPNLEDPTKAAFVSITLNGNIAGKAWLTTSEPGVVVISGTTVNFNGVIVTDNTTNIAIIGSLNRVDP